LDQLVGSRRSRGSPLLMALSSNESTGGWSAATRRLPSCPANVNLDFRYRLMSLAATPCENLRPWRAAAFMIRLRHMACVRSIRAGEGNCLGRRKSALNPAASKMALPWPTVNLHAGLADAPVAAAHAANRCECSAILKAFAIQCLSCKLTSFSNGFNYIQIFRPCLSSIKLTERLSVKVSLCSLDSKLLICKFEENN
jgi:hypothetical protein